MFHPGAVWSSGETVTLSFEINPFQVQGLNKLKSFITAHETVMPYYMSNTKVLFFLQRGSNRLSGALDPGKTVRMEMLKF